MPQGINPGGHVGVTVTAVLLPPVFAGGVRGGTVGSGAGPDPMPRPPSRPPSRPPVDTDVAVGPLEPVVEAEGVPVDDEEPVVATFGTPNNSAGL